MIQPMAAPSVRLATTNGMLRKAGRRVRPPVDRDQLRALMRRVGFSTQCAFGNALGFDHSQINKILNGDRGVTFGEAKAMAALLGIDLDRLATIFGYR